MSIRSHLLACLTLLQKWLISGLAGVPGRFPPPLRTAFPALLCIGLLGWQAVMVSSDGNGLGNLHPLTVLGPPPLLADLVGPTDPARLLHRLTGRQGTVFTMSSDVASVSVDPGQSAGFTLTARSTTKTNYKIDLQVQGLPATLTATLVPPAIMTNTGSSRLTVTATGTVAPGNYSFAAVGTTVIEGEVFSVTLPLAVTVRAGAQDFNLNANPTTASTLAGQSASYMILTSGVGGFTGPVAFSVSGLPPGSTAAFVPASVNAGSPTRLTVTTAAALAPQTYPLTVTGTAAINGQAVAHSLSLMLDIRRQEDFSLTVTPAMLAVAPGKTATFKVTTVAEGGFREKITFSTAGLPPGVKANFLSPEVQAGQNAELHLQIPLDLPRKAYSFTVVGSSNVKSQTLTRMAAVTLEVREDEIPQYLLLVAPEAPVLKPGGKVVFTVQARPVGGFAGPIQLSVSNLPKGVSDSFEKRTLLPNERTTLTLQAAPELTSGRFTFLVDGNLDVPGTEVVRRRTPVTLVIGGRFSSTSLSGVVMTAETNAVPIPNVTVSPVSNPSIQVRTDAQGRFTLKNIPPITHQIINVDGHTADTASVTYPVIPLGVDIVPYTDNQVGWVIYIPKIDTANNVPIIQNADHDQVITTPRIPNMKVVIPAHTTLINQDGSPVPQISITPLPSDKMPMPYPEGLELDRIPQIYTIQPGGAVASKPVQIFYPNLGQIPANEPVVFWGEEHDLGTFRIFGTGKPGPDGLQIIPDDDANFPGLKFGLSRFSWHFPATPCGPNNPNPAPGGPMVAGISVEPGSLSLGLGKSAQLRVLATITDGRVLDVTSLCSFSSSNPSAASVNTSGLVTASSSVIGTDDCNNTMISVKMEATPPGISCTRGSGGGRPAENTVPVKITNQNGFQVRVLSDYEPLPADGENVAVKNGHPVSFEIGFAEGGGTVKVTNVDANQVIYHQDIPAHMTREIELRLSNQQTKFKIESNCQEENITVFLIPNAELTLTPRLVPYSAIDPQGMVTTLADARLDVVFDLNTFTPPVSSVELQIRKGEQVVEVLDTG